VFLLDAYSTNNVLWNNLNKKNPIQNGDRLVELMLSVLVSYVEDGGVEPWLKPNIIIGIFCTKLRNFYTDIPDKFLFYLLFSYCFLLHVCMSVRACVCI
jgi:hypothetical protein